MINFEKELNAEQLDAVKHIKYTFFRDWLNAVRAATGKELFSVGEYWSQDLGKLRQYIHETEGTTSLFDVPLHMNRRKVMSRATIPEWIVKEADNKEALAKGIKRDLVENLADALSEMMTVRMDRDFIHNEIVV